MPTAKDIKRDLEGIEKCVRAVRQLATEPPTASLMIAVHKLAAHALATATTILAALPPDEGARADLYFETWKAAGGSASLLPGKLDATALKS